MAMNAIQIYPVLRESALQILETAAFLFLEDLLPERIPAPAQWDAQDVRISYSGHAEGSLELWVEPKLAEILAINMLGLDESIAEVARERSVDALRECLNMICGEFLLSYYGDEPIFNLSIPSSVEFLSLSPKEDCLVWLDAERYPLLVMHRSDG